jgi:CYTH domain-containing protein
VKTGTGLVRVEIEEETTREVFEAMWPLTEGKRVHKQRHRVTDGDLAWEIDHFVDRDLTLAEVELPSADVQPVPPDWLQPYVVRDVTDEAAYVNYNLAQ